MGEEKKPWELLLETAVRDGLTALEHLRRGASVLHPIDPHQGPVMHSIAELGLHAAHFLQLGQALSVLEVRSGDVLLLPIGKLDESVRQQLARFIQDRFPGVDVLSGPPEQPVLLLRKAP